MGSELGILLKMRFSKTRRVVMNFFKDKRAGYFSSCAVGLVSFVTAALYVSTYKNFAVQGIPVMSWTVFGLLLATGFSGTVLTTALSMVNRARYAVYISAALALATLCEYIYSMYYYVSVMAYGIDATFNAPFIACSVLVFSVFVASYVNVYLKVTATDPQDSQSI